MAETVDVLFVDDSPADVTLTLRAIQAEEFPEKFKVLRDGEETSVNTLNAAFHLQGVAA